MSGSGSSRPTQIFRGLRGAFLFQPDIENPSASRDSGGEFNCSDDERLHTAHCCVADLGWQLAAVLVACVVRMRELALRADRLLSLNDQRPRIGEPPVAICRTSELTGTRSDSSLFATSLAVVAWHHQLLDLKPKVQLNVYYYYNVIKHNCQY